VADDRIEAGREILARLDPGNEERLRALFDGVAPDMTGIILGFFGDVYARPGLSLRERMLVTLSAIAALGHAQPQLAAHVRNALNIGLTREEIAEALMQIAGYAGFPASLNALATAKAVFEQDGKS
jgi:4-carboxymuconolactone decarboxylase